VCGGTWRKAVPRVRTMPLLVRCARVRVVSAWYFTIWARGGDGIFHAFHGSWIAELRRDLNAGLPPADHYTPAEQIARLFLDTGREDSPMKFPPSGL